MSWTIYSKAESATDAREELERARDANASMFTEDDVVAQSDQAIDVAVMLAEALEEGEGYELTINLGGHARRQPGDYVTTSVSVASSPVQS